MSFRLSWLSECLKPSNFFWSLVPAGELGTLWLTQFNEARSQSGISGLISQTYLHTSFYFSTWHRAKPRTLRWSFWIYTVVAIWYSYFYLFILFFSRRGTGLSQEPSNRRNRPTVPVYSIAPHDFSHPYRGNRSTGPVYWTVRLLLLFYWPTILLHSQNCAFRS